MRPLLAVMLAAFWLSPISLSAQDILRFYPSQTDAPVAVRVPRGDLAHTGMLTSSQQQLRRAVQDIVGQLTKRTQEQSALLADVVKLNLYVRDSSWSQELSSLIVASWPRQRCPALTILPTALPHPSATLAADAVIRVLNPKQPDSAAKAAGILRREDDILYVSGRAAKGDALEATQDTMQELFNVLEFLKSGPERVVQVKAFLKPMSEASTFRKAIADSFGENELPPLVLVEWQSSSRATEIELIASTDAETTDQNLTFVTPPGDRSSPVFSRVSRVHADAVIYLGAVAGPKAADAEEEVQSALEKLRQHATSAGSDFLHLAKATYYVSHPAPSAALNRLRPDYYHPERPPAASKVAVLEIGVPGRGILIDLIAVPADLKSVNP